MITIVTAFFDIGRGDWTPDKGLPHYLERKTDTYLERFGNLATLENPMVIFTSKDLVPKVQQLRGNKPTHIIPFDFFGNCKELRQKIKDIQGSEEYKSKINPSQKSNPEYWSADYVLVNALKSTFIRHAIQMVGVDTDLVAWVDFGYCHSMDTLNGITKWNYNFDANKIHLFSIKDYLPGRPIDDIIYNNDVHMTGGVIVAGKEQWYKMEALINHSTNELIKNNLIDDDQTLLLMSYLLAPEEFEIHKVSPNDWFFIFKNFAEKY